MMHSGTKYDVLFLENNLENFRKICYTSHDEESKNRIYGRKNRCRCFCFTSMEYDSETGVKPVLITENQTRMNRLLETLKDLHVLPFLFAWQPKRELQADAESLFHMLEKEGYTFDRLRNVRIPKALSDAYENFLMSCMFDIRADVKEIRTKLNSHEKWWKILCARADGATLETISQQQNLTRERVRQIAERCVREYNQHGGIQLFCKIQAMEDGVLLIDEKLLKKYYGRDTDAFMYILRQIVKDEENYNLLPFMQDSLYVYSEKLNGFIFYAHRKYVRLAEEWMETLPNLISEEDLPAWLDKANGIPHELAELCLRNTYDKDGRVWKCGKIRVHNLCRGIMEEYYSDGIYIYDAQALREFRQRAVEKYGTGVTLPERDHALTAVISRIGMLRGRGIYIPAKHGILPEEILEKIRRYLAESESDSCMFNTLFSVFRDEITPYGIDNRFYLQGVLKMDMGDEYTYTRDYVSVSGKVTKIQDMVHAEVMKYTEPVDKQTITQKFPGVPDIAISYALMNPCIMNYFGKYIHKDNLKLTEEDKQVLHAEMDALLRDGRIHESQELMDRMQKKHPAMLKKLFVDTQFAMFSLAQICFGDEYIMDRPQIALRQSSGEAEILAKRAREIGGRKVRVNTPRDRQMATYTEIIESLKEYGTKGTTVNKLHARFHVTRQQLTIMQQEPEVIVLHNRMIHVDILQGWEEAKEELYQLAKALLDEYGVVRIRMFYEYCQERLGTFLKKNDLDSEDDVFYISRYLFDKTHYRNVHWYFHLHNQSISDRELDEDISFFGQVTEYFRKEHRPISFDELRERYVYLGYKVNSLKYNMRLCEEPIFYIYKPDLYILAEQLPVTDEWLQKIREQVMPLFADESSVIAFRSVTEKWMNTHFPQIPMEGVQWTRLLFQQMCLFYHDKLGVHTIRPFGIYDYNIPHSFLVTEKSGIETLSEATWLWMCQMGYRGKHLKVEELKRIMLDNQIISTTVQDSGRQFATGMSDPKRFRWDHDNRQVLIRK